MKRKNSLRIWQIQNHLPSFTDSRALAPEMSIAANNSATTKPSVIVAMLRPFAAMLNIKSNKWNDSRKSADA
jgi:hypothetical protein